MALSDTPLAELGPEDSSSTSFLDIASKVNVVNDTITNPDGSSFTVKQYVEQYLWNIIRRAKQRRLPLEQEWLAIQRMVALEHDIGQRYKGRSDAYLPVYARSRKTIVSSLTRGLFPSDDYMDVVDREQGDTEAAKACKAVIAYEFECSGLRRTIKGFLGQLSDFGVSCMKATFRSESVFRPGGKKATAYAASMPELGEMEENYDEGVNISTRSMFNVVVYPEWAENKRELQVEAERMEVPMDYVNAMHQNKRWLNVQEALAGGSAASDEFDWLNQATLADVASIPNTFELRGEDGSPVQSCIVVEAWARCKLPKSQYAPNENSNLAVPCRVVFVNGVAVMVRRNPFHHQSSPFVYARDNQVIGSFYSFGAGRLSRDLQYLANDSANQMNDCATLSLNPERLVNTNYFVGIPQPLAPGRAHKVRDIDKAMKWDRPPVEIIQYGQTWNAGIVAMAQDAAGAPPVLQGSKSASTATGTQVLQNNASGPLQDAVEDIEADAMVPLMQMTWELSRQYRSQKFFLELGEKPAMQPDPMTGQPVPVMDEMGKPVMVPDIAAFIPSEIVVKPQFKFLASSQANNRQMRQQGLMVFSDLALKLAPFLQMQGKMLNAEEVLRRGWSDGLGNRNFQRVVIPMPMMGMPPPGGPVPGGPGVEQPGPISAVPQGNVPGAEMNEPAAGEDVRGPRMPVEAETGQSVVATAPPGSGMPDPGGIY